MKIKERVDGFRALLKSEMSNSFLLEDTDGEHRLWRELSAEGKLAVIARDAAYYDLPFRQFAEAAKANVGEDSLEEASMRLVLRMETELHGLESLFPDDGRTESPPPLVERFRDIMASKREAYKRLLDDAAKRPSPAQRKDRER